MNRWMDKEVSSITKAMMSLHRNKTLTGTVRQGREKNMIKIFLNFLIALSNKKYNNNKNENLCSKMINRGNCFNIKEITKDMSCLSMLI